MSSTALIFCLLPASVSLGQVAMGVLCCLLITLQWIEFKWKDNRERRKGGETKQNKIKKKKKVLSFFPHLCSFFLLFCISPPTLPHLSRICFPLPCLRSQLGGEDRNNWKHREQKEGKTEGISGQSEAFSG